MNTTTQVTVQVGDQPGALLSICEALGNHNIEAISCTAGSNTEVHLVTDDAAAAEAALADIGPVTTKVVLAFEMTNKPGAISSIAQACNNAGVNIHSIYATTAGDGQATVYVDADDADAAAEACASV